MRNNPNLLLIIPKYTLTTKKNYDYWVPIGFGYVLSILRKNGYDFDCLNLNHLDGVLKDNIKNYLEKKKYDFIITGGMAIDYDSIKIIIDAVGEHKTKPKVILGGMIITPEPKVIFEALRPDFGLIGEAEETIIELLNCLKSQKDLSKIDGLIYRQNNKLFINKKRVPKASLDSIPFPDFESMGYNEFLKNCYPSLSCFYSIIDNPRVYSILGSRSCPFQCTFCYHYNNYRERSIKNIMKEVEFAVKRYDANLIMFFDECLSVTKERLFDFCDKIIELKNKLGRDLKWYAALRVDAVDEPVLKKMKEAGCFMVGYGLESYNLSVLNSMNKKITPEQIDKALKMTMANKIAVQGSFIFGDIVENLDTANETLEYWKNNCKGQLHLTFIRPFPNSKIYQYCLEKGIIRDKLAFMKNLNDITDVYENMTSLNDKDFLSLRKKVLEYLEKYRVVVSPLSMEKNGDTYSLKAKCPFCGEINKYSNFKIDKKFFFGFMVLCRSCLLRYYIFSRIKGFLFKHYSITKDLRDKRDKIIRNFREIKQKILSIH